MEWKNLGEIKSINYELLKTNGPDIHCDCENLEPPKRIKKFTRTVPLNSKKFDPVDHPEHYASGSVECIDWIGEMLSEEEFRGYLKGNALKYLWRHENKGNPKQDLGKCVWYIQKLQEKAREADSPAMADIPIKTSVDDVEAQTAAFKLWKLPERKKANIVIFDELADVAIDRVLSHLEIDRVVFNPPATIVFWKDGEKTVVKARKGKKKSDTDEFSEEVGLAMAIAKRYFGSRSAFKKAVREATRTDER